MPWPRILADAIVVVHALFVGFVVLGQLAIVLGAAFGRAWARNFWFRVLHLVAIGYVVFESLVGIACPLTEWENQLRLAAGQAGYPGDFIGYWAHRLIFYRAEPWVFTLVYVLFGLTVLATFLLVPPRRPGRPRPRARSGAEIPEGPARLGKVGLDGPGKFPSEEDEK